MGAEVPADAIDGIADTFGSQARHLLGERLAGSEEDGIGAEAAQFLDLFSPADDVEGAEAVELAEADDHFADFAGGGGLEEPFSRRHLEDIADHRQGGRGVDEEGGGLLVGPIIGNGEDLASGGDGVFGPGAEARSEDGDATSAAEAGQPAAAVRFDQADALKAGHRGESRLQAVAPGNVHQVRGVDRGGEHADEHFPALQGGHGDILLQAEDLTRLTGLFKDQALHAQCSSCRSKGASGHRGPRRERHGGTVPFAILRA